MVSVNVAKLKSELSHYLTLVQQGETVVVTSHGREIAEMNPRDKLKAAKPVDWVAYMREHPPVAQGLQGKSSAELVRQIRDEEWM